MLRDFLSFLSLALGAAILVIAGMATGNGDSSIVLCLVGLFFGGLSVYLYKIES